MVKVVVDLESKVVVVVVGVYCQEAISCCRSCHCYYCRPHRNVAPMVAVGSRHLQVLEQSACVSSNDVFVAQCRKVFVKVHIGLPSISIKSPQN